MVSGLGFEVFQGCCTGRHKPKVLQRLALDEGFAQGMHFLDSYQGVGGRSPTPHGTNPGIVKGDKASGGGRSYRAA